MQFIDKNTIKLDKTLNELDKFVIDFINVLKEHTDYVIISGYVSLLFGRARSTEDVDVFIKDLSKQNFEELYTDLKNHGYWCLNAEDPDVVYDMFKNKEAVRFAIRGDSVPNFEVKVARKPLQIGSFFDRVKVITEKGELLISSLERHIAFKRYYLKSEKDMEDALHIEELFKEKINFNSINEYKKLIEKEDG